MLEYGCLPIWVRNESGKLICAGLPEDLVHHYELEELLKEISKEYDALYINNSVEFSYQGFRTKEDETLFILYPSCLHQDKCTLLLNFLPLTAQILTDTMLDSPPQ